MQTFISKQPAKEAGQYVSKRFEEHRHEDVLFLVSGGSALAVLEDIDFAQASQKLHIACVDERLTSDTHAQNHTALHRAPSVAAQIEKTRGLVLTSAPQQNERHEDYAERLSETLENYLSRHTGAYVLALLGIGDDGHTASIFPGAHQEFADAYQKDTTYVAVNRPDLPQPFRVSITPSFIEEKISEVILYAVGSKKCDNILSYMHTKHFDAHEIPALIPARHPNSSLFTDCEALL